MSGKGLFKWWQFVLYPESAPNDWLELLRATQVPCAVSPLHKADDSIGKAHYHVLMCFNRACSDKRARQVCLACGGANGYVQCVFAPSGAYEYLTHKNNPEKEQFDESALPELLNGFMPPHIELDDEEMMTECIDLVFEYNILEFKDLCNHFRRQNQSEKANWVVRHAYGLKVLIDSIRFSHTESVREAREERERNEDEARRKGFKYEDFCEEKEDNPFS